ncbi:hypothetical protein J4E91_010473 [Alternaria rosae]|nr:hypothetical protein J4E91_010473 [Alternaria rosae]
MAQTRTAFIKLKDAIKDLETMTSQDSEMYYRTRWPGLYIAEDFANIPGHISIVQDYIDEAKEERIVNCLWDSTWKISRTLSGPTVNMAERAGTRVRSVLVLEAELLECMTILYKPAEGSGVRTYVTPFTERHQHILDCAAGQGSARRPHPQELNNSGDGIEPLSHGTGSKVSGDAVHAGERTEPKGKAMVTMKMPADAAQSESESDEEDRVNQATFLYCRRDGSGTYYLIVDDTKVYHKRLRPAEGVGFDDEAFTRMYEDGPEKPYQTFKLSRNPSIEISPFPKGCTIRFIGCALKSKRKQENSTSRVTVDDVSFHVIYTESDDLPHRDYEVGADGVSEGRNYPQWHDGIAKHNESVLEEFLDQLKALVMNAAGSWTDNRS